ncbi:gamma-glutamyl-gamma-aminobutyrate hydrolase family protein [Fusibacter ferrireducens]|uniref:Gamma-glutamyl-gamma-aminobutyrate hydrolase family protein n=1 Tax=Fusibacter ferrireducens TaxID=2785058 RepID=A0ABR9ZWF2_9FIRM|nr:gamma-glutamyl-gamma-aminobutyrate hydrolase family protein [Fusibacter ferrireducens]MBF4694215.1 gamma-glutamyl-gamma-aminobutyrate hydrolase family protein [Fusibacter ferrireducens]
MKPIIGVLANNLLQKDGKFPGLERTFVNQEYITAIEMSGGIPLIIPFLKEKSVIEKLIMQVDGLLITGGIDVSPQYFNEEPLPKLGYIEPELDQFHLYAIEYAEQHHKAMFGICRGLQILNVAFGGTLYQDLSYVESGTIKHWQDSRRCGRAHKIALTEASALKAIYDDGIMVNSFHHQCIKELARGFKVIAKASDDVIEAIESEQGNYKLAVQWHPESMTKDKDHHYKIFEYFIRQTVANIKV